jgi:hypothetical protein
LVAPIRLERPPASTAPAMRPIAGAKLSGLAEPGTDETVMNAV